MTPHTLLRCSGETTARHAVIIGHNGQWSTVREVQRCSDRAATSSEKGNLVTPYPVVRCSGDTSAAVAGAPAVTPSAPLGTML